MHLASLRLRELILHQIASGRGNSDQPPLLSEAPTPLGDLDRIWLEDRLKRSLRRARPVEEDPELQGVRAIIRDNLEGHQSALVKNSQELARKLQATQQKMSPAGILLVANAELRSSTSLIIAKVELEEGIRAREDTTEKGEATLAVEYLRDLLFTSAARVYKVGIFPQSDIHGGLLRGYVADTQSRGTVVAHYFLETYLGCKFVERSELLTERFSDAAQTWINRIDDSEKKLRYQVALISELQSNKQSLSVGQFAYDHLDVDDRDEFKSEMQKSNVPARQFEKSLDLVKGKIKKVKIETQSDVWVVASPEAMHNGTVSIETTPEGQSEVRVLDRVKRVSGTGPFSHSEPVNSED
ncbi:nucleoid-associated protein [Nonomuraea sp. NPDC050643]|uniref:nucleoid-associated protein n=1 Tax=Nonomuraea sp. NPDC050643 TaxID=3155660 RepID=UPI0033CB02DF